MVHNSDNQSWELIDGIKQNDQETFRRIYKMYYGKIKSMVNQFRIRHLEADDIFQEGLTRAVLNIRCGLFKGESAFYTYLYGICRNLCLKELSKNAKLVQVDVLPEATEIADDRFELLQRIIELRHQLDEPCRELIDLRFCQTDVEESPDKCLSFEKIAEMLNIRADNARKRLERCLERFRKLAQGDAQILDLIG